jgi:hypothetical protein
LGRGFFGGLGFMAIVDSFMVGDWLGGECASMRLYGHGDTNQQKN